jgi:hypothetical protein
MILYGCLLLAAFLGLCALMVWSVCRAAARANHEFLVDALWDDDDLAESA